MTKVKQIRTLVKPLFERNSDLALVGRWLFVKPVHHFARAVLIDRRGDPDKLVPSLTAIHLFELRQIFSISWSEYIPNEMSARPGLWFISEPDVGRSLIEAIEKHALPLLRGMQSLDDYLSFVSNHRMRHQLYDWHPQRFIVEIATGNLAAAKVTLQTHRDKWAVDHPSCDDEDREFFSELRLMCACLDVDDRASMAALLHKWEARTVKNLKIEHLWEPSPFPLEQMIR